MNKTWPWLLSLSRPPVTAAVTPAAATVAALATWLGFSVCASRALVERRYCGSSGATAATLGVRALRCDDDARL